MVVQWHQDDINCLRWMTKQKASGIYETARGMTRAPDPTVCPISALALHLSFNMDVDPVIDPFTEISRAEVIEAWDEGLKTWVTVPSWATTHLFFGRQIDQGLSLPSIQRDLNDAMVAINIKEDKAACMHLFRYTNVRRKHDLGMDREVIYREWAASVGPKVYGQVEIPWDNHFGGVGWADWQKLHFLGRSWATWQWLEDNHPDKAAFITSHLFSGAEQAKRDLDERGVGRCSTRNFVAMCHWLRIVFIQDAVFLRPTRSSHPVFSKHPLFLDAGFVSWFEHVWSPYVLHQHRQGSEQVRRHDQMPRDMVEEVVTAAISGKDPDLIDKSIRRLSDHFSPIKSAISSSTTLRFDHRLTLEHMYYQYSEGTRHQQPLMNYLDGNGNLRPETKSRWLDVNTRKRWAERKRLILKICKLGGSREAIKEIQAFVDSHDGNFIKAAKDIVL